MTSLLHFFCVKSSEVRTVRTVRLYIKLKLGLVATHITESIKKAFHFNFSSMEKKQNYSYNGKSYEQQATNKKNDSHM